VLVLHRVLTRDLTLVPPGYLPLGSSNQGPAGHPGNDVRAWPLVTSRREMGEAPLRDERETGAGGGPELTATVELLNRCRAGDLLARDLLIERYLPRLRRWSHGRLPAWTRDLLETADLVQEVVLHAFKTLEMFEPRFDGALQAYLRQAVYNRIQDEIRRGHRRPFHDSLGDIQRDPSPSPLEEVVGTQTLERYEAALQRLKPPDREAVIARVELGESFAEIAAELGKSSPDAARMAVNRALLRLAQEMRA